LATKKHSSLLL